MTPKELQEVKEMVELNRKSIDLLYEDSKEFKKMTRRALRLIASKRR